MESVLKNLRLPLIGISCASYLSASAQSAEKRKTRH